MYTLFLILIFAFVNRIDRVSAILIQLQSRKVVKAQEIAERFDISLRTVYRDIRTLEEAGVPLVGEAGVGYSIMDGFRLPPVMFTAEEATAFITAEKWVEKHTDVSMEENYKSAMYKIRSVLRSAEKDHLETIENHIEVLDNAYVPKTKHISGFLQQILTSISTKRVLRMNYHAYDRQESTLRDIEPVGIFHQGSHWHLIAFCQLRNDYRNFRTDRIASIAPTAFPFRKEHPSLKNYLSQITKEKELHSIVMHISKDIRKHFGDQKYYNGFVSEREIGDKIEMTFLTSSIEGFARWYMMFGDQAEIVSPENLKLKIREMAQKVIANLK